MGEMTHDRIVDAHVHVWISDVEKYPLAPVFEESDLWLPSFTPDEYFEHSRSVGNVRLNLVQMTWYGLDHSYLYFVQRSRGFTPGGNGIRSVVA